MREGALQYFNGRAKPKGDKMISDAYFTDKPLLISDASLTPKLNHAPKSVSCTPKRESRGERNKVMGKESPPTLNSA